MRYLHDKPLPLDDAHKLAAILAGASGGSVKDLAILAKSWTTLRDPLSAGIHLLFLHHLNSSEVPTKPKSDITGITDGVEEERAFWSLWALGSMGNPLLKIGLKNDPCGREIIEAWPGIFKWSAYFLITRLQLSDANQSTNTTSPQQSSLRGILRDVIAGCWCSMALSDSAKEVMLKTQGAIEIAARLWFFEGDPNADKVTLVSVGAPMGSFLLQLFSDTDDEADLDKIISATGGDLGNLVKTSLTRLKNGYKGHWFESSPGDCIPMLYFIQRLCCSKTKPEVPPTLLDNGIIPVLTKLLIRVASVLNNGSHDTDTRGDFVKFMATSFRVLLSCLENGTGLHWILQATQVGLLTAFVECSPYLNDLNHHDYTNVLSTITDIIPRFLVYCSVIRAVDAAFLRLEKTDRFFSLQKTKAREAFNDLALLTARRFGFVGQLKRMTKSATTCYNPKCHKVDIRDTFRKCSRCRNALYCSKECQVVHWKEFNHKEECQDPTKRRADPTAEESISIYERDLQYIQTLNICETRYHLPYLKRLAAREHPGTHLLALAVVLDYNTLPTIPRLELQTTWMRDHPSLFKHLGTGESLNECEAIYSTFIIGIVPYAGTCIPMYHVTPVPGGVWAKEIEESTTPEDGPGAAMDIPGFVDGMDREAEARRKMYFGF